MSGKDTVTMYVIMVLSAVIAFLVMSPLIIQRFFPQLLGG